MKISRRKSWLVRAIALALTPVLILFTPDLAEAATHAYGAPATSDELVLFDGFGEPGLGDMVHCTVTGYWETDIVVGGLFPSTSQIKIRGTCNTGWNVASADLTLTSQGCGASLHVGDVDGGGSFGGSMTGGTCAFDPTAGTVTTLCGTATSSSHSDLGISHTTDSDCEPWALGAPPTAPANTGGSCPYATVTRPSWTVINNETTADGDHVAYAHLSSPGITPVQADGAGWATYAIVGPASAMDVGAKDGNNALVTWGWQNLVYTIVGTLGSGHWGGVTGLVMGTTTPLTGKIRVSSSHWGGASDPPALQHADVIGIGIYRIPPGAQGAFRVPLDVPDHLGDNTTHSGSGNVQAFGMTDPAACQFYWGVKLVDFAGTTIDDPISDAGPPGESPTEPDPPVVTDPVTPTTDSTCQTFSLTDPTTWAGAGICILVKLVGALIALTRSILGVLQGLATTIASAIADALAGIMDLLGPILLGLAIPSPGAWPVGDVVDQWNSRPPGSLIDGLGGAIGGVVSGLQAGGGCGAGGFGNWVVRTSHGNANSSIGCPKESSAYLVVYDLVKAGLLVMTGIYVFHIMRSAVGNGGGGG